MDLDQQLQKFLICIVESRPGFASLALLAGIAFTAWMTTTIARRLLLFAFHLGRAVFTAVTSLSTLVAVCVVFAVFVVTR